MDEFLSEKEQIDQIKQWWRENGWYLVGGAVLAALGYLGYNQYNAWQDRIAEEAGTIYLELRLVLEDDDRADAEQLLSQLAADYPDSPYLDQARFLIAEDNLIRDTNRAITELETVMEGSRDEGLANIARLRLARVLAYDEQFDRALTTLSVADAGDFEARFSEVRGDIHVAMGNIEAAVSAYTEAILGAGDGTVNLQAVQLKLSDLVQANEPETEDEE